jgi:hypothetical protein
LVEPTVKSHELGYWNLAEDKAIRVPVRAARALCCFRATSQVDDHIADRLRAADENVALRGFLERLGTIDNSPGD